jgi:hypothetical protein
MTRKAAFSSKGVLAGIKNALALATIKKEPIE